ncbi:splicing factor U2af large subunit B-like isoform X3 [Nicotiana tomentosiformis]|uniref:splicing factor U2af large subunit B-like isoform X3 n=2 Tax=Nicotiana tomentosiformis TaxID=4098 RepID=UPI00051C5D2A|nr:splicing factor U2af large subunit B-like [Nicotiana tomentosiformis]XP_009603337.1 splicing factor U2af large subunit B-like [Nicotiana tomentosiformis]XP_009603338.1 splicing factor U2af large subunit B-like [Nicotiana tomentosiformis]XP_009603339.1 splicing factor U2af large subunit B-like [Nicotiana tomentosiformis]
MFPNMLPLASGQFGVLPVMPIQAMTHKATRHVRRVYVGGLPANANEQDAPCKVRRPSDYNPSLAATLGPSQPNPNLNMPKNMIWR